MARAAGKLWKKIGVCRRNRLPISPLRFSGGRLFRKSQKTILPGFEKLT
jgi:hypothetical protein